MKQILTISIIVFYSYSGYSLTLQLSDSLQNKHKLHKHPFPLRIDSVDIKNRVRDRDILRIHGEGVFDSTDGHGGARYFVDHAGKALLKTTIGVDRIIEEVALSDVSYPFDFVRSVVTYPDKAVSSNFSITSSTENYFHIGLSEKAIVNAMGKPNRIVTNNGMKTLIYEDSENEWSEVIFYQATFVFRKSKLIRMTIYCGE